jgi:hypothetical protein
VRYLFLVMPFLLFHLFRVRNQTHMASLTYRIQLQSSVDSGLESDPKLDVLFELDVARIARSMPTLTDIMQTAPSEKPVGEERRLMFKPQVAH